MPAFDRKREKKETVMRTFKTTYGSYHITDDYQIDLDYGVFNVKDQKYHYVELGPIDIWEPLFASGEESEDTETTAYLRSQGEFNDEKVIEFLRKNLPHRCAPSIHTAIILHLYLPCPEEYCLRDYQYIIAKAFDDGVTYLITEKRTVLERLLDIMTYCEGVVPNRHKITKEDDETPMVDITSLEDIL